MRLTIGQALEMLGRTASVNERIRILLKNCAADETYDNVNDIRGFLFDTYYEDPISADVKIVLNCTEDVTRIIEQIAKQPEENKHLAYFLDADKILADLAELNRDIKRQNRQ